MRSQTVLTGGGVVVAAFLLATNPVVADAARLITGADIKDGSVTGVDLKDVSVKGIDIKDGSLASKDLSAAARSDLSGTTGACGAGQELRWLQVALTADGGEVDRTLRIGRCFAAGEQIMGDGAVQWGEECDTGGAGQGCSFTGELEGTPGVDFFPDGGLTYVP